MKKIMFNDKYGLTQAVLDGRKTMTRRIVPNKIVDEWCDYLNTCAICNAAPLHVIECSNYKVGEIVAIAQRLVDVFYECKLERDVYHNDKGWNNKMFVKAKDMPHHIRITNVRVERLQDIPGDDCLREGIMFGEFTNTWDRYYFEVNGRNNITASTPKKAFVNLIDRVSGKGTWNSNPWVFVYEFEKID